MLAASCQQLNKLDACVVFNCGTGIWNIFMKMSFEKERNSFDYFFNHVTKDTANIIDNATF